MTRTHCLLAFVLLAGLALSVIPGARAEDEVPTEEEQPLSSTERTALDYACANLLVSEASPLLFEYTEVMDQFFSDTAPSSEQTESAFLYYRALQETVESLYARGVQLDNTGRFDLVAEELTRCTQIRNQYLDYTRTILDGYVLGSSNVKQRYAILDSLSAFNEEMSTLSRQFHSALPALLNRMDSALPCYARQCLTQ